MRRFICMASCALALAGGANLETLRNQSLVTFERVVIQGTREDLKVLLGKADGLAEEDYGTCVDWDDFINARSEAALLLQNDFAGENDLKASYDKLNGLYESLVSRPDIVGSLVIGVAHNKDGATATANIKDGEDVEYIYKWSTGATEKSTDVEEDELDGLSLEARAVNRVGKLEATLSMPEITNVKLSFKDSVPVVSWTLEEGCNMIPVDLMEIRLYRGRELVVETTASPSAGKLLLKKVSCGSYEVQCVAYFASLGTNIVTSKAYLAHVWNGFTVEQEPDCTHSGIEAMHCTRCNARGDSREIPPLGHDFSVDSVVLEPTCEKEGVKQHKCSRCDESTTEVIPALGHAFDDGLVAKEATCTQEGIIVHTCSRCSKMKADSLPALGHIWSKTYTVEKAPDCTQEGLEAVYCERCNERGEERRIEPLGHDWDEGEVVRYATSQREGALKYTCKRCKNVRLEPIPKLQDSYTGWRTIDGVDYWYEDDVRMGTIEDPKGVMGDGLIRGREIYDPASEAWYWLDATRAGAKAVDKEVWMPYIYNGIPDENGKWVRYDKDGHMVKGWYENDKGTYYYDLMTGAMAKGEVVIDEVPCIFDTITGIGLDMAFYGECWYEKGKRQGTYHDPNGVMGNGFIRGREIYDPASKAWYWLDARYDGKVAKKKEVWMPYIYQNETPGSTDGKWVRYDGEGHMITGWYVNDNGRYYYDPHTGAMAKGRWKASNGQVFEFDEMTGVLKP